MVSRATGCAVLLSAALWEKHGGYGVVLSNAVKNSGCGVAGVDKNCLLSSQRRFAPTSSQQ